MKNPFHSSKPTTNVASNERKDTRRVKSAIRQDDHKAVRDIRDWRDDVKRGKDQLRDGE